MISTIPRWHFSPLALAAAGALASCSKQSPPETGTLAGTVTVDG